MAMSLFSYKASFKPADIDVLFPTPINPKIVLGFRMVRDYLVSLIVPVLLVAMTWRRAAPDIATFFRNVPNPQTTGYAFRALSLAFILVMFTWVAMGYALSMYVNRNDRGSNSRKKLLGWIIALANFAVLGYLLFLGQRITSFGDFVGITQNAFLRTFFFTATLASKMIMGPLDGNFSESLIGAGSLFAIAVFCVYLTLRQAEWMYDQTAVRGFGSETIRQMHRKGDVVGVIAESARQGKIKVRKWGWFQQLNWKGYWSLVWKDVLIQWRSVKTIVLIFTAVGILVPVMTMIGSDHARRMQGYTILFGAGFITFMVANMLSQTGFSELLRRVDLQKPLPFSPAAITSSEILSKAAPSIIIASVVSLIGSILMPAQWPYGLASIAFFPTVGLLICSIMCLIVLIFPDIDDAAQRGFRGIVSLLGTALVVAPGALTFLAIATFFKLLVVGALVGAVINLGIAFVLTLATGGLYASFNPSE